mgnify:CR=1 FL=1
MTLQQEVIKRLRCKPEINVEEEIRGVFTKKDFTIIENLKKIYTNIYMMEKQRQDINNFKNISPYIVYIIYNILKEKII